MEVRLRALVTGAVEGLGRALVETLLNRGAEVRGLDINAPGLVAMEEHSGAGFSAMPVDLSDRTALDETLATMQAEEKFDLAILNAGIGATGKFEEIPASAYQLLLRINLEAPMLLASQLMAAGRIAKGGTIVFVSSLCHATGYPGASVYCASKDAIAVYAKSIRPACANNNVNVLTIFPGPVKTAHAERHAPEGADAEKRMAPEEMAKRILRAVNRRSGVLYPGAAAKLTRIAGWLMPAAMSKLMRRIIFEKLYQNQY